MEKRRVYICVDLKSFYASVECTDRGLDPLTTNLVVADPSRTEKTICLAVSPSLKAYGLSGRSRIFEVEQKIKQIKADTGKEITYIVAVPRMARYIQVSSEIYAVYLKYFSAEDIHVYSIDEVFIDVTNYLALYKCSARELAKNVVKAVMDKTGITATAGIAPNLYLAKIAMDIVAKHEPADENGVRLAELDEISFREKLWDHTPMTDFWRIGRGTVRRLEKNGMHTLGDVARMSLTHESWLFKIFGIDAEILIDHAWGYEPCRLSDIKNYKPKSNSLTNGQVLHCPYEFSKARVVVREMAEALALELVAKNLMTESATVYIGYDRVSVDEGTYDGDVVFDHYGRILPKPAHGTVNFGTATSSATKIGDMVIELFDKITDPELFVRRINICANNVSEDAYEQLDLFTDFAAVEREKKMQQAMLKIQNKYGKNSILKATDLEDGATTINRNQQIGGHKA